VHRRQGAFGWLRLPGPKVKVNDVAHNVIHDVAHNVIHDVAHNVIHDVAHNVIHDVAHNVINKPKSTLFRQNKPPRFSIFQKKEW
jgi:hypothetical protein